MLRFYSNEQLIKELISRNQLMPAPAKTERYGDHFQAIIGIGKDNVAYLELSDEDLAALEDTDGNCFDRDLSAGLRSGACWLGDQDLESLEPMNRVLAIVLDEVDYAQRKWKNASGRYQSDAEKPVEFWIAHIENYLLSARQKCRGVNKTEALHDLRKAAGLLLRCFLHRGVPVRPNPMDPTGQLQDYERKYRC